MQESFSDFPSRFSPPFPLLSPVFIAWAVSKLVRKCSRAANYLKLQLGDTFLENWENSRQNIIQQQHNIDLSINSLYCTNLYFIKAALCLFDNFIWFYFCFWKILCLTVEYFSGHILLICLTFNNAIYVWYHLVLFPNL